MIQAHVREQLIQSHENGTAGSPTHGLSIATLTPYLRQQVGVILCDERQTTINTFVH